MKYDLALIADCGANMALEKDLKAIDEVRTSTEGLNDLMSKLEADDISNEGLVDFARSITDTVLRIVNNFKAIVVKGGNRSELKFFYESHVMEVKRIEGKVLDEYKGIMVDFPTGMVGTYNAAIEAIVNAYQTMDAKMRISDSRKSADTILSSMSKGSDSHEDVVALSNKVLETELNRQEKAMKVLKKVFTGKPKGKETKAVTTLFKSMDELKACRMALMAVEDKITDLALIDDRLNKMYESAQLAVDFMQNSLDANDPESYVPSKEFIKTYMDYIGRLGFAFSNYSEIALNHMAVEHNLALVYTKLMEA